MIMANARQRADWARASSLMALIANCNRDPKSHAPFTPSDFDPFAPKKNIPKVGIEVLKQVFIDGRNTPCHKTPKPNQSSSPSSS